MSALRKQAVPGAHCSAGQEELASSRFCGKCFLGVEIGNVEEDTWSTSGLHMHVHMYTLKHRDT